MISRRAVLLLLLGVILLQTAWILATPPFRGTDEFDHAYRAAAVARGEWRAGAVATNGRGQYVNVPDALVRAAHAQCAALRYTGDDNCVGQPGPEPGLTRVGTGSGSYNPVYYWLVGSAGRCCDGAQSLYVMRIVSALLCDLFLVIAALALRRWATTPWPWLGLVIAMTPVLLYSTSITAPNGIEMTAAIGLWCTLLGVGESGRPGTDRSLLLLAIPCAMVLGTVRLLGPVFTVAIVAVCLLARWGSVGTVLRRHRAVIVAAVVLTGLAVAAGLAWSLTANLLETEQAPNAAVAGLQPQFLLLWVLQAVAAFPLRDEPAPAAVYALYLLVTVSFVVTALRRSIHRPEGWALALVSLLSLFGPVLPTLLTVRASGVIWQGRYGLPLAVGVFLIAGLALQRSGVRVPRRRVLLVLALLAMAASYVLSVGNVLLEERARQTSAQDPGWLQPPLALLVVLVLAGWSCLWVLVAPRRVPT